MEADDPELDRLQTNYRVAVDAWVVAIRAEEALAAVHHSVAKLDEWEGAHFAAEDARKIAEKAKEQYEDGLRSRLFGID